MTVPGRRQTVLAAVAILSFSVLAACGDDDSEGGGSADADSTFQIYALAPTSGPLAAPGAQVKAGLEAAVAVINENGGIDGKQVELKVDDDAGDPTQVAARVQQVLQSDDKPDLIVPGLTSTESVAALPLTNQEGVLAAGPAASTEMAEFDQFLSGTPTALDASKAALKTIADSGAKTVGVLVVDNVSGTSAAGDFDKYAGDFGLTITGSEKIAADATDASAQLERLKSDDPDALLYSGFSPVIAPVLQSKATIGWDVPVYADQTIGAFPYTSLVSPEENANFTVVVPSYVVKGSDSATSEAMTTAVEAIEKAYGKDFDAPLQAAIHSYMSLIIVKYAADTAKSDDASKIWAARTDLKLDKMPLYVGSSQLFTDDKSNWPEFPPEDWTPVIATGFEHGFVVPAS